MLGKAHIRARYGIDASCTWSLPLAQSCPMAMRGTISYLRKRMSPEAFAWQMASIGRRKGGVSDCASDIFRALTPIAAFAYADAATSGQWQFFLPIDAFLAFI